MLPLPAGREASSGAGAPRYERHRPERTLLYQLIEEYYPALKAHLAAQDSPLPGCVDREFEDYLKCGRLEHGFLRVRCDTCHAEQLLAFSCKRRGFCPSCGARRMAESAALLVDGVFPEQPVRQWVLSFPYPLRFLFASSPAIMGQVLGIVHRIIATHLIKKAGFSRKAAHTGAVTLMTCMDALMPRAQDAQERPSASAARSISISTFTCCFWMECMSSALMGCSSGG